MITTTVDVTGMTCERCERAVRGELERVAGVHQVDVDVATGRVVIRSVAPLPADVISAAIDEAGYELSGAPRQEPGS